MIASSVSVGILLKKNKEEQAKMCEMSDVTDFVVIYFHILAPYYIERKSHVHFVPKSV